MNTYLFTWNPKLWDWHDLEENINKLKTLGFLHRRWSCGRTKKINVGDRIFLIRLGVEPKGIMASGYALTEYYIAPHWDGTEGKTAQYIDIDFDIIIDSLNYPLFNPVEGVAPTSEQVWFPHQNGISIKPNLVNKLESSWLNFLSQNNLLDTGIYLNDSSALTTVTYTEGKAIEVLQTRYERNPYARQVCLESNGISCKVCDFNFEDIFGEIGRGYIHVHHIYPISEMKSEYEIDPINDLVPICPNCHAMIHTRKPPFSINEIKNIIKAGAC